MMVQGKKLLIDVLDAINLIELFIKDTPSFELYVSDYKTKSAVERQLGIIGEAIGKFNIRFPESSFQNTKEIVGFRNRLIHAYDNIDDSIVWAIIKKHLTGLKNEVVDKMKSI